MAPLKYARNYGPDGYQLLYRKPDDASLGFLKGSVLQFRIELEEISPPIWRRIHVPIEGNFWDLHVAIQDAMGWEDRHLHYFEIKAKGKQKTVRIGIPDFDLIDDDPEHEIYPGWEIPIEHYFNDLGLQARYVYDFGDDWGHTLRLEGYMAREKGAKYPLCLDGARACPPEDCGGIPGYGQLAEILANKKHPQHAEMKEWIGGKWDPERFDAGAIRFDDPFKRWKTVFLDEEPRPKKAKGKA